jgi:hypothetical protein
MSSTIVKFAQRLTFLFSISLVFTLLNFIKSQDCTSVSPSIILDCSKLSTNSNSCCFYKNNGKSYCTWWGSKYVGTTTKSDGLTYHCDNPRGSPCGSGLISSAKDCDRFSAPTNTCCYFRDGGISGCKWWAENYKGTTSIDGQTFQCSQNFLKLSLILTLLLFII